MSKIYLEIIHDKRLWLFCCVKSLRFRRNDLLFELKMDLHLHSIHTHYTKVGTHTHLCNPNYIIIIIINQLITHEKKRIRFKLIMSSIMILNQT